MSNHNLLVELFVEELPPRALKKLGEAFGSVLFERLLAQGLTGADSVLTSFACAGEPFKTKLIFCDIHNIFGVDTGIRTQT